MRKKQPVFAIFDNMNEAIDAIHSMKWTRHDIDQLSIVAKDWRTQIQSEKYQSTGDKVKTGSLEIVWDDLHIHTLKTARFFRRGVAGLLLAGPLSRWALETITSDGTDDGLYALGIGLEDMGVCEDDINECKADIRDGKILVLIPAKKTISIELGDKPNTKRRISDMAKYC